MGDRFAQQAEAQLRAFILAAEKGVDIAPVWNKSDREHLIVGSEPSSVTAAAETASKKLGWNKTWHVDADHIRLETVDRFVPLFSISSRSTWLTPSANPSPAASVKAFVDRHPELVGQVVIPGIARRSENEPHLRGKNREQIPLRRARKPVASTATSSRSRAKTNSSPKFPWTKVDSPQTPAGVTGYPGRARGQNIPIQTVAPKFTGRFNKGVDYVGRRRPV